MCRKSPQTLKDRLVDTKGKETWRVRAEGGDTGLGPADKAGGPGLWGLPTPSTLSLLLP